MNRVNILGVKVDKVNIMQSADKIMEFLNGAEGLKRVFTPNSEIIMRAYKDSEFAEKLNKADLLTADGIGVVYASRLLRNPIKERAAGFDIAKEVLKRISKTGHKLYLFGAKPGIAEEAKEKLEAEYSGINIVGTHNGYFKREEIAEIIEDINASGAELLFVCLGAPAQEKWIDENAEKLKVKVAMGIGGSLDVFAGRTERAPEFYCKHGLEWFYRLKKEPWRAKRMLELPKFAFTVLIKGRKYK